MGNVAAVKFYEDLGSFLELRIEMIHHRHDSPPPGYGHNGKRLRNHGISGSVAENVAAVIFVVILIIVLIALGLSGAFNGSGRSHYSSGSSSYVPDSTSTTTVTETAHPTGWYNPWATTKVTEVGPTHVSSGKVFKNGRWVMQTDSVRHERDRINRRRLARLGA